MAAQKIFQYEDNEITIVDGNMFYIDSADNFKTDSGWQNAAQHTQIVYIPTFQSMAMDNDVPEFQPVKEYDDFIADINSLLEKQAARRQQNRA